MVAQQLTPELTQPNVLVEIDHGPPIEPHQESQRPAPEQLQGKENESWGIMFDAEASTSTFGPAELQRIEPDRFQAAGFAPGGTTASFMVESNGTKVEVLEGDRVPHPGDFLTSRRPSWAHCSKYEPTVQSTAEVRKAFVGMRRGEFMENDNQHVVGQYAIGITPSPSSGWNPPARVRQEASFDTYHSVLAPLPATAATEPSAIRKMRLLNDGPVQVVWTSSQAMSPLLSPLRSREVFFNESFNGRGNAHNLLVVNEERVAVDQDASVFSGMSKNTCHCDLPLGGFCNGRLKEPQSTGRTVTSDVEPPLPMSWAAGSKTGFSVDTIGVAREVFMWMIQYNMVSCPASQPPNIYMADSKDR